MSGTSDGVVMPQQSQKMVTFVSTLMNRTASRGKVFSTSPVASAMPRWKYR